MLCANTVAIDDQPPCRYLAGSAPMNTTCSRVYTTMPMPVDHSTARIRSRLGLRDSPAIWTAESNPISANTTASGMARKMPLTPPPVMPAGNFGRNPPPALKLLPLRENASAMIVTTGIATFHHTMVVLVCANSRTPYVLMIAKISASPAATRNPLGNVTPLALNIQPRPCRPDRYSMAASTSIGISDIENSQLTQPIMKPPRP